mmetsp:Transcript_1129/g.4208  ORF Transcript_1129/g.4208 Transcript_1129/m.4208 type:complete len:489 (+) Transcript_1129:1014-2480(+)
MCLQGVRHDGGHCFPAFQGQTFRRRRRRVVRRQAQLGARRGDGDGGRERRGRGRRCQRFGNLRTFAQRLSFFHAPHEDASQHPCSRICSLKKQSGSLDFWPPFETERLGLGNDVMRLVGNEAFPKSKRITFRRGSTFDVAASYAADGLPIGAFKIVVPEGGAVAKVRLAVDYSFSGTLQISSAEAYTEVTLDAAAAAEAKDNEAKDAKEAADAPATESKEESKEESNVVRKKYTKAPLVVTASMPNMTQAQLDSAKEVEVSMANEDRIITETFDMRNELEAYIYKMRDEVVGPLRPFTTDTEKAAFEASLEEIENWLYEAEYDTTKSSYKEKLGKLEALGSPLAARQSEDEKRPETVALLRKKLAALEAFLAAVPTAVPGHYDKEEVATVTSNAAEGQRWLAGLVSRQSALSKDQDAVLTCSMVTAKHGEMDKNTKQILSKKPPVSETKPPTPAPEAADAKAADAEMPDAKAAEPKDEDMPDASPKKE